MIATAFKPSDEGRALILRLYAASGRDEVARITWADPQPRSLWLSDASERPGTRVTGPVDIPAWGLVTLRAELDQ